MIEWIRQTFGRGSRADRMIRALPNPSRILRNTDAWTRTLVALGDSIETWEPHESRLLTIIKDLADAADVAGALIGASGDEKHASVSEQVRLGLATVGLADDAFDAFWRNKGRPVLESYLTLRKVRG